MRLLSFFTTVTPALHKIEHTEKAQQLIFSVRDLDRKKED